MRMRASALLIVALAVLIYPGVFAWIWYTKIPPATPIAQSTANIDNLPASSPAANAPASGTRQKEDDEAWNSNHVFSSIDSMSKDGTTETGNTRPLVPVGQLLSFIDSLVKGGTMVAKDADELRSKIVDASIDGGKEVTVDVAKALIDRYIKPHDAEKKTDADGHSPGTQINNTYCWAPEPYLPARAPITHHPQHIKKSSIGCRKG